MDAGKTVNVCVCATSNVDRLIGCVRRMINWMAGDWWGSGQGNGISGGMNELAAAAAEIDITY